MKKTVHKYKQSIGLAVLTSALVIPVLPANAATVEASSMKRGITFCGGNHFTRANGTEQSFTNYIFRNYSSKPLSITRVRVYDSNGSVLADFPNANPFPANFKPTLTARQATNLSTQWFLSYNNTIARPLTIQVSWEYQNNERGPALTTGVVRHFKLVSNGRSLSSFAASSNCLVRAN